MPWAAVCTAASCSAKVGVAGFSSAANTDDCGSRSCIMRLGVKDSVVGLVIPTGYSFNLDAFSIYLTLAVVFIAQATNTPLSLHDLGLVLIISLGASKGAHG